MENNGKTETACPFPLSKNWTKPFVKSLMNRFLFSSPHPPTKLQEKPPTWQLPEPVFDRNSVSELTETANIYTVLFNIITVLFWLAKIEYIFFKTNKLCN
jgi:hypothetical protein